MTVDEYKDSILNIRESSSSESRLCGALSTGKKRPGDWGGGELSSSMLMAGFPFRKSSIKESMLEKFVDLQSASVDTVSLLLVSNTNGKWKQKIMYNSRTISIFLPL